MLASITRALVGSSGERREHWVSDHAAPECQLCGQGFTVTRRRHHCRRCGRVCCHRCWHVERELQCGHCVAGADERLWGPPDELSMLPRSVTALTVSEIIDPAGIQRLLVTDLVADSPAVGAGAQLGDWVLSLGGERLFSAARLQRVWKKWHDSAPGEHVRIQVQQRLRSALVTELPAHPEFSGHYILVSDAWPNNRPSWYSYNLRVRLYVDSHGRWSFGQDADAVSGASGVVRSQAKARGLLPLDHTVWEHCGERVRGWAPCDVQLTMCDTELRAGAKCALLVSAAPRQWRSATVTSLTGGEGAVMVGVRLDNGGGEDFVAAASGRLFPEPGDEHDDPSPPPLPAGVTASVRKRGKSKKKTARKEDEQKKKKGRTRGETAKGHNAGLSAHPPPAKWDTDSSEEGLSASVFAAAAAVDRNSASPSPSPSPVSPEPRVQSAANEIRAPTLFSAGAVNEVRAATLSSAANEVRASTISSTADGRSAPVSSPAVREEASSSDDGDLLHVTMKRARPPRGRRPTFIDR
eukprot:Hpha_TRINITY_DN14228_c0_g2::TRINITY_DN14228_c0_g2_i1::g.22826::m.22826